jgi:hypothetical protein
VKKSILLIFLAAFILIMLVSGCGSSVITPESIPTATITDTAMPTLTITITTTPDLCASENIKAEVDKVHRHMREFDDASKLAASMPREQLSTPIANLQKIRRDAEDELIPPCLAKLKDYEILHMNSVINTLIAFMSVNDPLAVDCVDVEQNTDEEAICQSIAAARQQHDQYILELAKILELPIVTPDATIKASETPTP